MCHYSWCWDCKAIFTDGHGWLCNPFGCNISKDSIQRHFLIRGLLRTLYILLGILLLPILIVFFIPCASAWKGGSLVYECMNAAHELRIQNQFPDGETPTEPCFSTFCVLRSIGVGLASLVFFFLGFILNLIVAPFLLILMLCCAPCYLCAKYRN